MELLLDARTRIGERCDDLSCLGFESQGSDNPNRKTAAYARVSSHHEQEDLERQKQGVEIYCARLSQRMNIEVVADLGARLHLYFLRIISDEFPGGWRRLAVFHTGAPAEQNDPFLVPSMALSQIR